MKKEEVAEKMKYGKHEKCSFCGRTGHSKHAHKKGGSTGSGGDKGDTIEGDSGHHYGPEDKFGRKDVSKEKATRRAKNGKMPNSDWET